MGWPIDLKQKEWELVIREYDHDLLVAEVRFKDLVGSDRGDLRYWRDIDSSNLFVFK